MAGNQAYKEGEYQKAQDLYSKAIYHNPNCAAYYGNRAAALMMTQNYRAALDDSIKSIQLDENFTKV